MRSVPLLLAALFLIPRMSSADMALHACMDPNPVLAKAMLEADVIVLARVESLDEKNQPTGRGWHYSWETRVKIEAVWRGRYAGPSARFESSCSGLPRSSMNHCRRPPALKGQRVVLFLKKAADGKFYLAQPASGVFGSCPDDSLVARAKRVDARLFQRILDASR